MTEFCAFGSLFDFLHSTEHIWNRSTGTVTARRRVESNFTDDSAEPTKRNRVVTKSFEIAESPTVSMKRPLLTSTSFNERKVAEGGGLASWLSHALDESYLIHMRSQAVPNSQSDARRVSSVSGSLTNDRLEALQEAIRSSGVYDNYFRRSLKGNDIEAGLAPAADIDSVISVLESNSMVRQTLLSHRQNHLCE